MEDAQLTELPGSIDLTPPTACVNCNSSDVVKGYSSPLCADCRQAFIKYPIPLPIKLFAIAVGLVLVFALFSLPKNLSTGIHLERGKRFEEKKQFLSAQREFNKVIKTMPDNLEANAHLTIAAFYNLDLTTFYTAMEKIAGKRYEKSELLGQVNVVIKEAEDLIPDTALANMINSYSDQTGGVPDSAYAGYLKQHSSNLYGYLAYANSLYDKGAFKTCDSVLKQVFNITVSCLPALQLQSSVHRKLGNLEASIKACEKILEINQEAPYAYCGMARTYLKQQKNELGLKMAMQGMSIDSSDAYSMATLALAYHVNNMPVKRDALLKALQAKGDSGALYYRQHVVDIIDQKESL